MSEWSTENMFVSFLWGFAIGALTLCLLLWIFDGTQLQTRNSAIESGVAEWRIDKVTGEKSFEWIACEKGIE